MLNKEKVLASIVLSLIVYGLYYLTTYVFNLSSPNFLFTFIGGLSGFWVADFLKK